MPGPLLLQPKCNITHYTLHKSHLLTQLSIYVLNRQVQNIPVNGYRGTTGARHAKKAHMTTDAFSILDDS
jgi:hypothetical protein